MNTDKIKQELKKCGQAFVVSFSAEDKIKLETILKEKGLGVIVEPQYTVGKSMEAQDEITGIIYHTESKPVLTGYKISLR